MPYGNKATLRLLKWPSSLYNCYKIQCPLGNHGAGLPLKNSMDFQLKLTFTVKK